MTLVNKRRARKLWIALLIFIVAIFLTTFLIPYSDPGKFWFIAILGMVYPFLLMLVLICLIVCALKRSRWFLLPLIALFINWKQTSVVFSWHWKKEFSDAGPPNSLRVLSWNVSRWTENKNSMKGNPDNSYRRLMMEAVQNENADVLCFQEFFECYAPEFFPANIPPLEKMGYKYHFFSPSSVTISGQFQTGLIILSKYPIIDSAYFKTVSGGHSEGFSYADIRFQNKTIRIFNTHLESIGLSRGSGGEIGATEGIKSIGGKIKRSYYLRSLQADQLRAEMDRSPYPLMLCGDVDDLPNSYAYFKVKGNLQDAFLKKGSGLGRTFRFVLPTLRIDCIMVDKKLKIEQFTTRPYKYSDHYPLLTDVSF